MGGELKLPIDPSHFYDPTTKPALPRLDQHREEILAQYGFDAGERQRLENAGAFGAVTAEAS